MSAFQWTDLDSKAVDTARVLAADAVEKVGNGHPGTAISLAPVAYLLFNKVMRHDPSDEKWLGRDRFILSVGHSSLTLYNQLYLHGYGLELDDLKALRTWGSLTPGHPEYGHTKGVEITTGPLGQGLASATGFAYAARYERGLFDPKAPTGTSPFDHFVYVIAGDGDMRGDYYGYDGPCPPWNDSIKHHYVFTIYALDVKELRLTGPFNGKDALQAMSPHILDKASITGIYSLNPSLK